jgi:hypothetical protein
MRSSDPELGLSMIGSPGPDPVIDVDQYCTVVPLLPPRRKVAVWRFMSFVLL